MGMTYDELEQLKEIKHGLVKDLIEYGKKEGKLNEIDTLAHAIKNMCKIIEDGEMNLQNYSGDHWMMDPYRYSSRPMYSRNMPDIMYDGYSQARGRGPEAARDSMGRYSSHGDLVSELYSVMGSTTNDMERREVQSLIDKLQQNR